MTRMVTITRDEYESLLEAREDLEDLQAYDRAKADGGPSLPAEAVKRILDGESPVRVWREARGLNQSELGRLSGVNRVVIADIETGRRGGSVKALLAIAAALSLSVEDLV